MFVVPGKANLEACGISGNLPSPQALKLSAANSIKQYTKKGSLLCESIPGQTTDASAKIPACLP
jgi:hypothetical protein